jgi:threonyl-tRNA synthetase
VSLTSLATRPLDIEPEEWDEDEQYNTDCVVALITVEPGDEINTVYSLSEDMYQMASDIDRKDLVLLPFAHLSDSLAASDQAKKIFNELEDDLRKYRETRVMRSHFGSHKELLLDVAGHPGNARFRSY